MKTPRNLSDPTRIVQRLCAALMLLLNRAALMRSALILLTTWSCLQPAGAQTLFTEGDALADRTYNTDNGPTNSQLTLDFPITQAGVFENVLTWGEHDNDHLSGLDGIGQSFKVFVLRPLNSTNYQVVFATGYLTVTNIGTNIFTVSGAPVLLQANDVIAHYGRGIPFGNGTGGPSSVYIGVNLPAPVAGTTITVPGPVYPVYNDGGRNYAIQVQARAPLLVTNNSDSGSGSLRQAVLNAGTMGGQNVITFTNTLSGQTILLTNGQIELGGNLAIDASALPNGIQLNGNASSRVFQVDNGASVLLNSLTITNASSAFGGGVINYGTLTVKNCTFAGNQAANFSDGGGAIENWTSATLTVINSTFTGNQVPGSNNDGGGAIVDEGGTLTVINSTFVGNSAPGQYGGGIKCFGTLLLTNSIVCSNTAFGNPNIAASFSGSNNLVDTNALVAPLGNYGGPTPTMPPLLGSPAINAGAATGLTTDQRGFPRVVGSAPDIGAVEFQYGLVVSNTTDSGENSLRADVAYDSPGSTITFAPGLSGQTIALFGPLAPNRNLNIDASALAQGITLNAQSYGRVFVTASGVTNVLTGLVLANGAADSDSGGAVQNSGNLTFNQCSFTGNSAQFADGGAIYNAGTLRLAGCSLYGNSATPDFNHDYGLGGVIYNDGAVALVQCTLTGNTGGGIFNEGTLAVTNCTVCSNTAVASSGGGIFTGTGRTLILNNSIVAANSDNSGVGQDIESVNSTNVFLGANIVQSYDWNGGSSTGTTPINANPLLMALGNYGGPTKTMLPLPGSPAIDAGSDSVTTVLATDQRGTGYPRRTGAHVDIGAVESGDPIVGFNYTVVTTTNDFYSPLTNNGVSLRSAVAFAPVNAFITFAPALSGQTIVLTNGEIELTTNVTIMAAGLPNGIQISGNNVTRIFNIGSGAAVTLDSLTLRNANGGGADGGAVYNAGNTVINYCTFTANSTGSGGAIKNAAGTLVLNECTLTGNSTLGGGGGGIVNYASLFLNSCTLAGNSAGFYGGAVYSETGAHVTLDSTIAAGNSAIDIYNNGTLTYVSSNIVQAVSGSSSGPAPINAAPGLAALGSYGGPTKTMPPLSGSPAINAGDDSSTNFFTTDQRGYPRLAGSHVDIGAVEGAYVSSSIGKLTNIVQLGNGSVQFGFTNVAGANLPVLATTNLTLPASNWTEIGFAVENPAGTGRYQFTDPNATNYSRRFYRVKSP